MAKVMISLPDDLLARVDAEAVRRGTTRGALLEFAARREVGDGLPREDRLDRLARLADGWGADAHPLAVLKADRGRLSANG